MFHKLWSKPKQHTPIKILPKDKTIETPLPKKKKEEYGVVDNVNPVINKKEVVCRYCNYKFKVNYETKTPRSCPYCSKPFFVDI